MTDWLQVLYGAAVVFSAIFVGLLFLRRWTKTGIAVGAFHLLVAILLSVAPFRALMDPDYEGFTLGLVRFPGHTAVVPAAVFLGWALSAAFISVTVNKSRWLLFVTVGDWLIAINFAAAMILSPSVGTIQLGQYLTIGGLASLFLMAVIFILAPFFCGFWALRRNAL